MAWELGDKTLTLDRPRLMAILNVTPDSFYDGGALPDVESAVRRAIECIEQGADMLDVGGESTRPGSARVDPDEQIRRVAPVVAAIRAAAPTIPISVDTTRSAVAAAALDAGADAINDVSGATEDPAMLDMVAARGCGLILMHRLTTPDRDSYSDEYRRPPEYTDVADDVRRYLTDRVARATRVGIAPERILIDPGLGFGKSVQQNLELIRRTGELSGIGAGVLSGISRKSFTRGVGASVGGDPADRLSATLALGVMHLLAGARLFRVHDVAEHAGALGSAWAVGKPARERVSWGPDER